MKSLPLTQTLKTLTLVLACNFIAITTQAQNDASPVSASIHISNPNPYERETVFVTLTIRSEGVQMGGNFNIKNLPDKRQFDLFSKFEGLPIKRTSNGHRIVEEQSFRCRARALDSGQIEIAPTIQLVARRRRRTLIGNAWEDYPLSINVQPIQLTVKPMPPAPANFSGAVGNFKFMASIDPTDIVKGDLITLTTSITGEGYTEGLRVPQLLNSTECKVYEPRQAKSEANTVKHEQIVIPQSNKVQAVPAVTLTIFNPQKGQYQQISQGPFPITFHAATTTEREHFRPAETNKPQNAISAKSKPGNPRINNIFKNLGQARHKQATTHDTTTAHMAPSTQSRPIFEIPENSKLSILKRQNHWLLIESDQRRGWIREQDIAE